MVQFSQHFLDDLRSRSDAVRIIGEKVTLERSGNNYKGKCPFHQEKTPSFYVYPNNGSYHCFGCEAHGSVFDFVMQTRSMTFPQAVEELARLAGMKLPTSGAGGRSKEQQAHYDALSSALNEAQRFFRESLRSSSFTQRYLESRGLNQETIDRFGVGYAPNSFSALKTKLSGIEEKHLIECGLLAKKEQQDSFDFFRHRVMFPIRNTRGQVMGFGGRVCSRDQIPKYINSPQSPVFRKRWELYGLYEAKQASKRLSRLVVVEGYVDVLTLAQHGLEGAVAPLGTALTPQQFQTLTRNASEVVCCFDGDEAGRNAAWRALKIGFEQMKEGLTIRIVLLPERHDPDSFVREFGMDKFEKLIAESKTASDFFFEEMLDGADLSNVEARVGVIEQAMRDIRTIPYATYRQAMISRLSEAVGVPIEEIQKIGPEEPSGPPPVRTQTRNPNSNRLSRGNRAVIRSLAHDFRFVPLIPSGLLRDMRKFRDKSLAFDAILRARDDRLGNFAEVLASYAGSDLQQILSRAASGPLPEIRGEVAGNGPINALEALVFGYERSERRQEILDAEPKEARSAFEKALKDHTSSDSDGSSRGAEYQHKK